MKAKIIVLFSVLLVLAVKGDPDPRTITATTPTPLLPSLSESSAFQGKQVIAYLTPEQLTALQTGQGVLEPVIVVNPQSQNNQENPGLVQIPQNYFGNNEHLREQLEQQNSFTSFQQNFDIVENHKKIASIFGPESDHEEQSQIPWYPSIINNAQQPQWLDSSKNFYGITSEEPESFKYLSDDSVTDNDRRNTPKSEKPKNSEKSATTTEKPEEFNYNYYNFYTEKRGDNIDIQILHPNSKENQRDDLEAQKDIETKKYKLVPYDNINKKSSALQESAQQVIQRNEQEHSDENEQKLNEDVFESDYESSSNRYNKAKVELKQPIEVKKVTAKNYEAPRPFMKDPKSVNVNVPQPFYVPLEIVRHVHYYPELEDTEV